MKALRESKPRTSTTCLFRTVKLVDYVEIRIVAELDGILVAIGPCGSRALIGLIRFLAG